MAQDVIASSVNRVVVGLGITGVSCARYLYRQGAPFTVVDTRANPPGLGALRREMPEIDVYTGVYPQDLIDAADELIVSPGIPLDEPLVSRAREAGVAIVGDIDLFMREAQAPVIGITGSNAKSTVTELVGLMAQAAGLDVGVGGNLGIPALDLLAPGRQLYVLELSSFQLERAAQLGLDVATVLNVSADHLDRHGNLQGYHQAKHRIFHGCAKAVVNRDDRLTIPLVAESVGLTSWSMAEPELKGFGLRVIDGEETLCHGFKSVLKVSELALSGRHNVANSLAALAIGYSAGLPLAAMSEALRNFQGLEHRCQLVAQINGVNYVNDSKGTNVGATLAALQGLGGEQDILLIAGGQAKGADFSQLCEVVTRHCKAVFLIGEDASVMAQVLSEYVSLSIEDSLEEAVQCAASLAQSGDTVLLSPACASFDMFTGYIERGEVFCRAVNDLREGAV